MLIVCDNNVIGDRKDWLGTGLLILLGYYCIDADATDAAVRVINLRFYKTDRKRLFGIEIFMVSTLVPQQFYSSIVALARPERSEGFGNHIRLLSRFL